MHFLKYLKNIFFKSFIELNNHLKCFLKKHLKSIWY